MSQITIDGVTLNFKDSSFTGDQWEQVATWVLNGGAEGIDKNAEIATEKATQAIQAAAAAAASNSSAESNAKLSESYAVGGTGSRQGEDTDNAKYYARLAASAAGGGVLSVNGMLPDENGNVEIDAGGGVKTVNGVAPDDSGNVVIDAGGGVKTINNVAPDENGNVQITANGIGAATMTEVNNAISAAITGAIEGSY